MVLGSRLDDESQIVPVRIQTTIQSIKEIVGNHSDADIYAMLKETNMDPNETTQKLLNQDPFHEVKRKRDKKKEAVMASNPNVNPVDSDGGRREAGGWNRVTDNRFEWVASSPSPAEIEALERRFPEVIQVPARTLEEATSDWSQRAVIARSLSRWIPTDAIVREFRRARIAGEVESVSLAHRHFFFQFSDPAAKQTVLGRPWMANGQVIAVEDWRPQFVPSEGAMATALLWVRLPSLPIEFWSEEIIGSILSAAGSFQFIDAATRERRRGGLPVPASGWT